MFSTSTVTHRLGSHPIHKLELDGMTGQSRLVLSGSLFRRQRQRKAKAKKKIKKNQAILLLLLLQRRKETSVSNAATDPGLHRLHHLVRSGQVLVLGFDGAPSGLQGFPRGAHSTVALTSPIIPIKACNRPDRLDQVGRGWYRVVPQVFPGPLFAPLSTHDAFWGGQCFPMFPTLYQTWCARASLSKDSSTGIPETPYLGRLIPDPMPDSALSSCRPDRIGPDP